MLYTLAHLHQVFKDVLCICFLGTDEAGTHSTQQVSAANLSRLWMMCASSEDRGVYRAAPSLCNSCYLALTHIASQRPQGTQLHQLNRPAFKFTISYKVRLFHFARLIFEVRIWGKAAVQGPRLSSQSLNDIPGMLDQFIQLCVRSSFAVFFPEESLQSHASSLPPAFHRL